MNIEDEIFKRSIIDFTKLLKYGFQKENENYIYTKEIIDNSFRVVIEIDKNGNVRGKIYDLVFNEEYTNYRVENNMGEFVSQIKEQFERILLEIRDKCTTSKYFITNQANELIELIKEKYNVNPEFLWESSPNSAVFRNKRSDKWFGLIMNIDRSKIIKGEQGEVEVLNIKLDRETPKYLEIKGIYPAYHMSKKSWVSIILDNTLSTKEIMELINISYDFTNTLGEWLIPANPKYYDVMNAFNDTDTITWKQSNKILPNDIVYLYVAEPISAIMFKCQVVETDIPYLYEDNNLKMNKVMKIKLLKRYNQDEFSFKKLKEYDVKSIRGPRSVPAKLSKELNRK